MLTGINEAVALVPKITPAGYARKQGASYSGSRFLTLQLSDLHYGTDLTAEDHLRPYSNVEECRATAAVVSNALDYKPDHRNETTLHIWFGGDDFAGLLGHDDKSLPALQVQLARAAHIEAQTIALLAARFRNVLVTRDWGNHGRDTLRHKGRADNFKWLNWEFMLWKLVRAMCRDLKNVRWQTSRRGYGYTKLFGWQLFRTHGDTILGGKPGSQGFARQLAGINSSPYYKGLNHIVLLGHWHSGETFQVEHTRVFVNGALIPPDGYSQSNGYLSGAGQWLFETTEKFPVGDMRFVQLAPSDYTDSKWDGLITPWTEELEFYEEDVA